MIKLLRGIGSIVAFVGTLITILNCAFSMIISNPSEQVIPMILAYGFISIQGYLMVIISNIMKEK